MLADRKATGDNEATPAALAAVLQRLSSRRIPGIADATVEDIRRAILAKDDPRRGRVFLKEGDLASDPITCVRTGWCEKPGGGAVVFVVMLARDDPGARTRDESHRELAATAGRLIETLLDLIDPGPGESQGSPDLPVPKGWRTEDTAYPPPWAKELPWKGDIQIRFPPGWFDAKSPNFWSYPVLYRLEGDVLASRDDMEKALRSYDAGLYAGKFEGSRIKIDIGEDRKADEAGACRRPPLDHHRRVRPVRDQAGVEDPPGGLPLVLPRVEEDGGLDPPVAPRIQGGRCGLEDADPVLGGARLPRLGTLISRRAISPRRWSTTISMVESPKVSSDRHRAWHDPTAD